MTWLYLALAAYLINAVAFIFDKYLLHAPIPRPFAYSFWVALLSITTVVLIPFGVGFPGWSFLAVAIASGAAFFLGLIFLYRAIRIGEITSASTKVGASTAVFTFVFSYLILDASVLNQAHIVALGLMVFGMLILSRMNWKMLGIAIIAGAFSGLSFTLLKWAFSHSDLINGIFWTRMGFVAAALLSLLFINARKEIFASFRQSSSSSKYLFLANKIIAAAGFIILYYAIYKGNAALINGLSGLQYFFVFMIAIAFRQIIPGIGENLDRKSMIIKIAGLIFILDGFLILFTKI
ncbi:MAG: hypothetical protein A2568_03420 [Candidatus Yanofskybacteria bacterium RIFOXYD1_FULL_44_17]|uniref:EamA domain-containing protein n=1 Tax=Candidatus Yanofskybacteria bacterium GW2011_GWE2_40_11 TaxID=1619033 RepID=A0A0G0QTR6_9BACT|nr:MAG: hypothetical protein UT69_C0006G0011 [Candidatus Yanofskybacteria bacterium GW2011_GWE1_40_10]KKR40716.1 MAG: hypothetical protein UT75_C0005G0024 [Candidatus Yanofskybacteria bacterium GW2011_GWE2_40_11]OGN35999.1 MAG: hypothetical protein A2207_03000 [Candidatus Yanofskybacteria bacterium RIFOXYA1_FULL_44_17]OGN36399.1 MAG: hypothetical protein A2241_01485 [Candidatus Yanofskybacteria bacterium RIFOXYA2_FULL_45_28]OGN37422.1 MAG: hypothetical protein A2371_00450 [Candidatus Yanofskyba